MKRIVFVFCSFLLLSCTFNSNVSGWYVENLSMQDIDVFFGDTKLTIKSSTTMFLDEIPIDSNISIHNDYHVNYTLSYFYTTKPNEPHRRYLRIQDKNKYIYNIKNSYNKNIKFDMNGEEYLLEPNAEKELIVYDSPFDFSFFSEEYKLPYTQNYKDGIYYIFVY